MLQILRTLKDTRIEIDSDHKTIALARSTIPGDPNETTRFIFGQNEAELVWHDLSIAILNGEGMTAAIIIGSTEEAEQMARKLREVFPVMGEATIGQREAKFGSRVIKRFFVNSNSINGTDK